MGLVVYNGTKYMADGCKSPLNRPFGGAMVVAQVGHFEGISYDQLDRGELDILGIHGVQAVIFTHMSTNWLSDGFYMVLPYYLSFA